MSVIEIWNQKLQAQLELATKTNIFLSDKKDWGPNSDVD